MNNSNIIETNRIKNALIKRRKEFIIYFEYMFLNFIQVLNIFLNILLNVTIGISLKQILLFILFGEKFQEMEYLVLFCPKILSQTSDAKVV